jgi:hypothetical protein
MFSKFSLGRSLLYLLQFFSYRSLDLGEISGPPATIFKLGLNLLDSRHQIVLTSFKLIMWTSFICLNGSSYCHIADPKLLNLT